MMMFGCLYIYIQKNVVQFSRTNPLNVYHSKSEVVIYDYADINVPMLATRFKRRLKGYRLIGYECAEFVENHREL